MWWLLIAPALAWNHLGVRWAPEDMPVAYCVTDCDGIFDCEARIQAAFAAWQAPGLSSVYMGRCAATSLSTNNINEIGLVAVPGMGRVSTRPTVIDSETCGGYERLREVDLLVSSEHGWATHDQITAGQCAAGMDLDEHLLHEIGHFWGMDHSCAEFETCNDPIERDAVMYWAPGACSVQQRAPNPDDVAGIEALYPADCNADTGFEPDDVAPADSDDKAEPGCGCASGPSEVTWLWLVVGASLFRRR